MKYKGIIFDLDGTLVDSLQDIADAMNEMLSCNGYATHDESVYKLFVGSGIRNLVYKALPAYARKEDIINRCFAEMMALYRNNFVDKSDLYPGISDMLDQLALKGVKMSILSNKADEFVSKVVDVLLPNWEFESVIGLTTEEDKKPNPKYALQLANEMGFNASEIVFMGDSSVDMKTAINAGMTPVGVLWGFRSKEELLENGAKYLLEKPSDFFEVIDIG
jgi:phosphoglycolate phosphatase